MKAIIFTNADWHFYAHLLPIAKEAKDRGLDIKILTHTDKHKEIIESHGLSVIPITINRSSINPFLEIILLYNIVKILWKEKPDLLLNFTLKPILYGSIASFLCRTPKVLNTFLGMGYIFISDKLLMKIISRAFCATLSIISRFKNMRFVVQNSDDKKLLSKLYLAKEDRIITQCSVGIDTSSFPALPEPKLTDSDKIIFVLLSRMLIDKGVNEFIEAAKILSQKNINAEFWLVGSPDEQNKSSISNETLTKHHQEGFVKYIGYKEDIKSIWEQAHVAVLPSYREGLSRTLLEAGAYKRAIITTDAPGGRELVKNLENGLLVMPKNSEDLASAMEIIATDKDLRMKLAENMRKHIILEYDSSILAKKMLDLSMQ